MRADHTTFMHLPAGSRWVLLPLLLLLATLGTEGLQAQDVIRASGGTNISIDNVATETFVSLDGPTIRETASGQLASGGTVILDVPSGYIWNDALQSGDISILIDPMGANNTGLLMEFTSISETQVVFTVTQESETKGNGQGPGRVTIGGLEVRPTSTAIPNSAQITNSGTTGPTGISYGDLSTVAGSVEAVRVETEVDGSGVVVPDQTIHAGQSVEVYAIGRDTGGNFIENVALASGSDWTLTNRTGTIQASALNPANNLRSAEFSPTRIGTANIRANYSGADVVESGTITVLPRPASTMEVLTQPSANATAGSPFGTQPQIRLKDTYGNIVTNDNSTEVTAVIASGSGTLLGQTTATASSGVVTFSDLQINEAGSVTLRFESSGLSSLTSNTVTIGPATASQLIWLEQPTNVLPGETISPAFELQMQDAYNNLVQQSGVDVTVDEEPDTESFLAGTLTVQTNSSGVAVFNGVEIQNDNNLADEENPVQVQASFSGITTPAVSDDFYILSSGSLVGFEVTASGGGSIGTQTAGVPFDIDLRALDGEGNTFTDFTGTVEITSDSDFLQGGGTTASFTAGVLTGHTVSLSGSGDVRLTATSAAESRSGFSNHFTLQPGPVDTGESGLSVSQDELTADGESTTTVTVQLRDEYGNKLTSGGETIELATSAGTLANGTEQGQVRLLAEDQGDGTYTATLTSSSTVETATLEAWLGEESNSGVLIDSATVNFVAGGVESFVVTIPVNGGTPVTQTAGTSFDISVEAVDENGNRVSGFGGDLIFSTNSTISAGGTATMSNGYLENHSITLTESGSTVTITATLDDLLQITGESDEFTVEATSPSISESQVVANPSLIQNDGVMQSTIVITVRDSYGNRVLTDLLPDVTLQADRLELNGSPSSGTPAASVGSLSFDASTSTYRTTVTSSTTIELVEFTGSINSSSITETAELDIVQPNTWSPGGGPTSVQIDWNRAENWSLNRVPGEDDFVIIPGNLSNYPDLDLNITIGSLLVEANGELVLFGGNFIDVAGQAEINGTLDIEDNTQLFVRGNFVGSGTFTGGESVSVELYGDVSIDNFFVRTTNSIVEFKGENLQTVDVTNFLAERIEIENDVLVNSGDLIDTNNLVISENMTLELAEGAGIVLDTFEEITGLGTLVLNDNTLVLGGNTDLSNFDTSEATVVFGVRSGEDPTQAAHLAQQQIGSLEQFQSVIINNDHGVRTFDNIQVSGTLTLENGDLIISSGQSLIAPDIVYTGGELTFRRSINEVKGWRMMSTPVATTFSDLFDGLVTQGIDGSTYPDDTSYQPSILWYLENYEGTDLQRWRKPTAMSATMEPGQGYFFYVFGNVDGESEYNDTLPHVLTASGQEHTGENGTFDFGVTYTANGDKGWNLIGNPFGATLDWDDSGNWTKTHMDNAIYIWDPDASSYKTWNGITGSLGSGLIAPFHAFWVKASPADPEVDTPSLTVSREVKTTDGQFLQQSEEAPDPEEEWALELNVTADGMEATTHFSFSEEGKVGSDRRDAWYLEPMPFEETWLMFYSLNGQSEPMAIQNLPKRSRDPIEIPLGVGGYRDGSPVQGIYEIELGDRTTLPEGWSVVLTDHRTGEQIDLWDVERWVARVDQFREPKSRIRTESNGSDNPEENEEAVAGLSSNDSAGGIAIPANRLTPQPMALSSIELQSDHDTPFTLTITPDPLATGDIPEELLLRQNYPNPFSGSTTIEYGIPSDLDQEKVELTLFSILGQRVETLVATERPAGYHQVVWDASRYASGVYLYRLRVGGKVRTGKMTHIK